MCKTSYNITRHPWCRRLFASTHRSFFWECVLKRVKIIFASFWFLYVIVFCTFIVIVLHINKSGWWGSIWVHTRGCKLTEWLALLLSCSAAMVLCTALLCWHYSALLLCCKLTQMSSSDWIDRPNFLQASAACITVLYCALRKYIWQLGQIHFANRTNTLYKMDKYSL